MAYGARLESVLGASPRGFESPILRHRTPGLVGAPGFSLAGALRLGARGAPATGAASATSSSAAARCTGSAVEAGAVTVGARGAQGPRPAGRPPGVEPRSGERVHWRAVLRVTVSSEPPQGRNAARIRVRCRVRGGSSYSPRHSAPPPVLPGRSPRERAPVPRPGGAACGACSAERRGPRPVPWTVPVRGARASARPSGAASGFCAAERPRRAQAPRPSTTSAAGSAASSSPSTKSFEARRPDPMQLHPLAQRESMRRRH